MQHRLNDVAPRFVEMAHSIGMCVAATDGGGKQPPTRVEQPVWGWDGITLTGWLSTATDSPKYRHLITAPTLSITYWHPEPDMCTADSDRRAGPRRLERVRRRGWRSSG